MDNNEYRPMSYEESVQNQLTERIQSFPDEMDTKSPQDPEEALSAMLDEYKESSSGQLNGVRESNNFGMELPKQLVKENGHQTFVTDDATDKAEAGYGSFITISIMFSIMTIIMSLLILFLT